MTFHDYVMDFHDNPWVPKKADVFSLSLRTGRISRGLIVADGVFAGFDRAGQLIEIQFLDVSPGKLRPKKIGKEYRIKPDEIKKLA